MPSSRLERVLAGLGLVVALALAGFTVPAALDYRSSAPPETASAEPQPTVARRTTTQTTVRPAREEPTTPATTAASPTRAELRLVAARGDCWIDVRAGSADGPSLFAGILEQGTWRRFSARSLWVEIGAPAALDMTLNGDPVTTLPAVPATMAVTPAGVRVVDT
jgi:hypothetical protein